MAGWNMLRHANVVPILGLCILESSLSIVTPLCPGDVLKYVASQPNCGRMNLISDVAEGLRFLYGQQPPIAHKAIKATNVLVKSDGRACLMDYELSWMIRDSQPTVPLTDFIWNAPEVLGFDGNGPSPFTLQADVYSFAMVAFAILAGQEPYYSRKKVPKPMKDMAFLTRDIVLEGRRPPTTEIRQNIALSQRLWPILEACWSENL